jgi:hypothetical protein
MKRVVAMANPFDTRPYNMFFHTVCDGADTLTWLNDQWEAGWEYVEGLHSTPNDKGTILVLFVARKR